MKVIYRLGAVASGVALMVGLSVSVTTPASAATSKTHVAARTKAAQARAVMLAALRTSRAPGVRAPTPPGRAAIAGAASTVYYYNWSGYADTDTSGDVYTKASGAWKVPTLTCTSEDRIDSFWVGLDGYSDSTVEQLGTTSQCYEGTAYYYSWWEMYPTNSEQNVGTPLPGDSVTATVTYTAAGKFKLSLTDATTPAASFSTTQSCAVGVVCARSSAEWIAERPEGATGMFPLAQFSPFILTGATVTGAPLGGTSTSGVISSFPDEAIDMIDTTDTYDLSSVGALRASGNGFTATWANSY